MALHVTSSTALELARELVQMADESMEGAVELALREAIARRRSSVRAKRELLDHIASHCAALRVHEKRASDEIVGYDVDGLPS